ncbi:hypothetical protein BDZ91DRAFT_282241 [Kalaharituber pfeilii]|nr:hypothetical protein BDZ91DRAFT_282241 [Kalaharituber pfeilii]
MDMLDWSPDFCLACDRQSVSGGAYCSQSCRLADLERASGGSSASSSPQALPTSWAPPTPGTGFYLPPALNFSSLSSRQPSPSASLPTSRAPFSSTPPSAAYSSQSNSASYSPSGRSSSLYPSPSRTSLSSLQSMPQHETGYLSDKAKNELRDYASSFDLVRDWKRRMTVV